MREGKQFETDWKNSCIKEGIYIERFKDSAMWGSSSKVRASKNPCDFIMYSKPYLFLLEMKSTKGTSFSFDEKIIKQHQIDSLLKAQEHDGIIAGFLFNFRERETAKTKRANSVYFVGIKTFANYKGNCTKGSINEVECKAIGVTINQNRKLIHYNYDIKGFANSIKPFVEYDNLIA